MTQSPRRPPKRPTYRPRPGVSGLTILHVLPWLNFGGVETYVLKLARGQQARGHRVLVASAGGQLEAQFTAAGIAHLRVRINDGHFLQGVMRLCRVVAREEVDLICAHNWTAGAAVGLAARLTGVAHCFTVHGTRSPLRRHFVFWWGSRVIAVSRESREQLVRDFGLAEERVVESMIGVDTEHFQPMPASTAVLSELGLEGAGPVVVHVSRLSHSKACVALGLIEGAPALDRNAQIVIVGDGPFANRVRAEADAMNARLGRRAVVTAGGRSDIADLLNAAEVAVGTASVALEAMACGKPLVAAGKAGFIGVVTPQNFARAEAVCFGDHPVARSGSGQLPPVTADALVGSIGPLLDSPERRRELSEAGRRAVVERCSLERMATSVEEVYRTILGDPLRLRRVVILHLNQIGDLLFCLPALKALRLRFPGAAITSVLRPHLVDLLRESPYVDHLVERGAEGALALAKRLRADRPDLVIALSHSPASAMLACLTGAKERVGFADAGLARLLTRRVQVRGLPSPAKMMRLAACLGADPADASYVGLLRISQADRDGARRLLEEAGVGEGGLIALGPTASGGRSHKNWVAERFAAVADALAGSPFGDLEGPPQDGPEGPRAAQVAIVGAAEDAGYAEGIVAAMARPALNLAGRTTTGQLAAVLERADLFVGIDSGPMHLAAAMGTPVVAVFGPSDPEQTAPQGAGHVVVSRRLACSPCKWPCETRECMTEITVDDVLQAVERVKERV